MMAQSKKDGNYYALKIINENAAMEANMKAVLNESKILQQLDHPNIVKLYELSDDGVYTLANGQTKKYSAITQGPLRDHPTRPGRRSL